MVLFCSCLSVYHYPRCPYPWPSGTSPCLNIPVPEAELSDVPFLGPDLCCPFPRPCHVPDNPYTKWPFSESTLLLSLSLSLFLTVFFLVPVPVCHFLVPFLDHVMSLITRTLNGLSMNLTCYCPFPCPCPWLFFSLSLSNIPIMSLITRKLNILTLNLTWCCPFPWPCL